MTKPFRKSGPWIAALAAWASTASLQAADFPTLLQSYNPLGYWHFNETAASPALNSVANSGTAGSIADGYAVLDVGKGEPGRIGNSVRLVNNGNTVGYCGSKVDMPYSAAINPKAPFTVEFWAKPNSLGADGTGFSPISCFDPNFYGGANRSGWLFYLNSAGRWQFRLGLTSGYAVTLNASPGNATPGTWQHIVASYDGSKATIYVDGTKRGEAAVGAGWKPNTQMALRLGGTPLTGTTSDGPYISNSGISGNRGYDGWLDEVAIYPTVLSDAAVAAHFAAAGDPATYTTAVQADAPAGYWKMEEAAVTTPDPSTFPTVANSGSSGAAADGIVHWGAATAQQGPVGGGLSADNKAVFFDGENGFVELGEEAALHFSGNVTLMAWVKPTGKDFFRNILARGWDGAYLETFLRISRGIGDVWPNTGYGDGNYYEIGSAGAAASFDSAQYPIPAGDIGNWVFLAGTYDGASWNLYRNGVLVSSTASPNGAIDVTNRWAIGSRSDPTADEGLFFRGSIDEPAVFNRALSAGDIAALYQAAKLPPVITTAVQGPTDPVFKGASVAFSVWAEGGAPLTYAWSSNSVALGVTTTNLTINNINSGTHTIAVTVTNPDGTVTSSATIVVVAAPPVFTKLPQSVTRFPGFPFTLTTEVSGSTPLSYQWNLGPNPILNANGPTYTAVASGATAGDYTVTVSNEAATTNSPIAKVTVLTPPAGYASAVVGNTPPPVAFWRLGESSGTVAADFVGGHDGQYFNATLGQPGSSAVDPDMAASFTGVNSYVGRISGVVGPGINFSGHVNFTIEVFAKGAPGQADESTLIAKGNGQSGTVATEQFAIDVFGGHYRFLTRGGGNSLYTADAAVGPNGGWQHIAGVYDDANGQMFIYVNGELSGTGGTRPAGLRSSAADVTIGSKHLGNDPAFDGSFVGQIDDVAIYSVALASDTIFQHYSAVYGSTTAPFITADPQSATNYIGLPVTFRVTAAGSLPLTFQWKKGTQNIDFANSSEYTIDALSLTDAGDYSVVISNPVNPAGLTSAAAKLTVLPAPTTPPDIQGLVIHLPFNNSLGDVTGRGNGATGMRNVNGTASTAAATYVADGQLGGAFQFSTSVTVDSTNTTYASLGIRPDLQFGTDTDFTFAFWIRAPANYAEGDLPFITDTIGSTFGTGLVMAYTYGNGADPSWPGGWALSAYGTDGGIGGRGEIGGVNDGGWHHLVYVFDRTDGIETYLDGRLSHFNKQAGTSFQDVGNIDTANPFTIGQDPTGAYVAGIVPLFAGGDIDDLGVFRRALTPLEAASLFVAGKNGLSFTGSAEPPQIGISRAGNVITITFSGGTLQGADVVTGPYTTVTGATSPMVLTAPTANKFYRVRQ